MTFVLQFLNRSHFYFIYRILQRALGLAERSYWIGASDQATENEWRWVNGHRIKPNDVGLWHPNEPNNNGNQDCGASHFSNSYVEGYLIWDGACTASFFSVCEKLI